MEKTKHFAKINGYVETVFGRKLWLPEINSPNGPRRQASERAAINAPMQGTAADIIKRAMLDVDRWLFDKDIKASIVMQVHDELVLEVSESILEAVVVEVKKMMSGAATLEVPLIVDIGFGENWDQAH